MKFRWGRLRGSDNTLMGRLKSFGGKEYAEETRERSEQTDEGILGGAKWKKSECRIQQEFVLPRDSRPQIGEERGEKPWRSSAHKTYTREQHAR